DLGVDRVFAVDHGVRRGALLREVNDRLGTVVADHRVREVGVGQVTDEDVDLLAGDLLPDRSPGLQRLDRDETVHDHLQVVLTPNEVVGDSDLVTTLREMESSRPAEVAVTAEDQDAHVSSTYLVCLVCVGSLVAGGEPRPPDHGSKRVYLEHHQK